MNTDPPTRLPDFPRGAPLTLDFEGTKVPAFANETVAVALLAAGEQVLSRSLKFHRPRSAFCLTGDCGACLMRVDGQPNLRACRTLVRPGLHCSRQNAWPSADLDILAAADLMFPEGMDHHTLMTAPRPLNQVMQRVVQQLGGLGRLPDNAPRLADLPLSHSRHVAVAVIGGGPAGLAAATAAAQTLAAKGGAVVLVDAAPTAGGSYLSDPRLGRPAAAQAIRAAAAAGVELLLGATAAGFYAEEHNPAAPAGECGLLLVATPTGVLKLSAARYIYATGGHLQNALFIDNDRPGVLAGRAVGLLLGGYGVRLGRRPLIVGQGDYAEALAAALLATGAQVERIDGERERMARAVGSPWVDGAVVTTESGLERHVVCDLIAIVEPPAAASELPQLHGAKVAFDPRLGFYVLTDGAGHTSVPSVFSCGEVTGSYTAQTAAQHGQHVGGVAAHELLG
jgi:sarcosine oxidase subunit alpha